MDIILTSHCKLFNNQQFAVVFALKLCPDIVSIQTKCAVTYSVFLEKMSVCQPVIIYSGV